MQIKKKWLVILSLVGVLLAVLCSLFPKYFLISSIPILAIIFLIRLNNRLLILTLCVLINESMFFFLEVRTGEILRNLMVLIVLLLFVKELFGKEENYIASNKYNFKVSIFFFLILILFEIFNASINYLQPLSLGVASAKYYLIYLFYFVLAKWLLSGKVKKESIENVIIYLSAVASSIYIVQYLVYDNIQFLHVTFLERFGEVRFYQGINLILFGTIFIFKRLLISNKTLFGNLAILCLNLFYVIYICNSRTITLPFLLSIFLVLIFQKRYNRYLFLYFVIFLVVLTASFISLKGLNSDYQIFSLVEMSVNDVLNKSGTFKVRLNEINFYYRQFIENPLLGIGLLHEGNSNSYLALGKQYEYYLSDIGILGFIFKFGLLGLMITINITLKYLNILNEFWKKKIISYDYLLYIMYIALASLFVPIFDQLTNMLYLAICFAMIDFDLNKGLISKEYFKIENLEKKVSLNDISFHKK